MPRVFKDKKGNFVFRSGLLTRICDTSFDNLLTRATIGLGKNDTRLRQIRNAFDEAAKKYGIR